MVCVFSGTDGLRKVFHIRLNDEMSRGSEKDNKAQDAGFFLIQNMYIAMVSGLRLHVSGL